MSTRTKLHAALTDILGTNNVYYQPPSTVKMKYPAIVYNREALDLKHANNGIYIGKTRYSITLMDFDPDSQYIEKILALPYCSYDRHYTADNLNHDTFSVYY